MSWFAAPLLALSFLFAACASDQFVKREFLDPRQDRAEQLTRAALAGCAIAAAFGAGLLL